MLLPPAINDRENNERSFTICGSRLTKNPNASHSEAATEELTSLPSRCSITANGERPPVERETVYNFLFTNFCLTHHRSEMHRTFCGVIVTLLLGIAARAEQTEQDEYTLYELLSPDSASFKITYEVTATTPGAKAFFNPIRKGSVASDEAVFDMMTGEPLKFEQVSGAQAKEQGLAEADAETD